MSATPSRSHAFTPAPSSSDTGIMPDLYRLIVGPINAAYYDQHFQRFESAGRVAPTWNHSAAFFTLTWLILRKLWRPAGIYAALLTALLLVWWLVLHGRVPLAVEASLCALGALVLCAVPGFLGNALYYQHVRNQTLATLGKASSLAQARVMLSAQAPTKEQLNLAMALQALVALAITGLLISHLDFAPRAATAPVPAGPPNIVIPTVESLRATQPEAFTPDVPLPLQPAPEAMTAPATAAPMPAPGTRPEAKAKEDTETLSIVEFAQAVPAAARSTPAPSAANSSVDASTARPSAKTPVATAPAPQTAPAAPAGPSKKAGAAVDPNRLIVGKFYVNAGVYAQAANVQSAAKRLQAMQLNTLQQTVASNKGELTRLRIGPFDTRKQAEQAAEKARQLRIQPTVFQHTQP